jgi:FMN-dependent oxidoreductase (nitrilotriacetate monooxygenase family)
MTAKPFHMGWFLNGTSVPAWGQPFSGAIGTQWESAEIFVDLARAMERAKMDFVLIEDNTFIGDKYEDSMRVYLKHAFQGPRQDPMIVATLLAQATTRLGVIPTAGTFAYHPYMLSRLIGSLDQLSGGRIGVNLVTGTSDRALQNYGQPAMAEHDSRYDVADDFIGAALSLWSTWEADAVVADPETGVWADHTKVHRADYESPHYSTRGPLNSGPLPQGRPVIAQAGGSPRGIEFAAQNADVIIAIQPTSAKMKEYREKVRAAAVTIGRNPDEIKVLFGIWPIVGASEAEAAERHEARKQGVIDDMELSLAALSKTMDIDFSLLPLDLPLAELDLTTNGTQGFVNFAAANPTLTLREVVITRGGAAGPLFVGTAESVAQQMEDTMAEVGGDGFLIATNGVTRRFIAEITDGLMPELQKRGLTRREYSHTQLRDNLLEF